MSLPKGVLFQQLTVTKVEAGLRPVLLIRKEAAAGRRPMESTSARRFRKEKRKQDVCRQIDNQGDNVRSTANIFYVAAFAPRALSDKSEVSATARPAMARRNSTTKTDHSGRGRARRCAARFFEPEGAMPIDIVIMPPSWRSFHELPTAFVRAAARCAPWT